MSALPCVVCASGPRSNKRELVAKPSTPSPPQRQPSHVTNSCSGLILGNQIVLAPISVILPWLGDSDVGAASSDGVGAVCDDASFLRQRKVQLSVATANGPGLLWNPAALECVFTVEALRDQLSEMLTQLGPAWSVLWSLPNVDSSVRSPASQRTADW